MNGQSLQQFIKTASLCSRLAYPSQHVAPVIHISKRPKQPPPLCQRPCTNSDKNVPFGLVFEILYTYANQTFPQLSTRICLADSLGKLIFWSANLRFPSSILGPSGQIMIF